MLVLHFILFRLIVLGPFQSHLLKAIQYVSAASALNIQPDMYTFLKAQFSQSWKGSLKMDKRERTLSAW